jgi:hypothetical protein
MPLQHNPPRLPNKFHNEWLVTWEKLESGLKMAEQLCVPLYGFLYLVDDDVLLIAESKQGRDTSRVYRNPEDNQRGQDCQREWIYPHGKRINQTQYQQINSYGRKRQ